MELLLIRHAIAEDRVAFAASGEDDSRRPLTDRGRRQMTRATAGLVRLVERIDLLASSPYLRAMQTAEVVAAGYGALVVESIPSLEPERAASSFLTWLRAHREAQVVAVTGHEPHLGILATWLLTGVAAPRIPLKKGGACLLRFASHPAKGRGELRWLLTPSLLRRVGRSG